MSARAGTVSETILESGMSLTTTLSSSELLDQLILDQMLSSCTLKFPVIACFSLSKAGKNADLIIEV